MSYKRFLLFFFISISLCGLFLFSFFFYLSKIYEHNSYNEIVERQIENNSVYGTAFNNFPMLYFLELTRQQTPKVLMVGSSRSGWFKAKYFNCPFVTTPNASDTFFQMKVFLDKVLQFYTPEVVLMEFDPWLLLQNLQDLQLEKKKFFIGDEKSINFSKIYTSMKLLVKDNMPIINPFNTLFLKNPYTDYDSLGAIAMEKSFGFLRDGSFFHAPIYFGYGKVVDKKFSASLWKIKNNQEVFRWAKTYNRENLAILEKIIKDLKDRGIIVIPIVMPLPPTIYKETYVKHPNRYAYWKELSDNANKLGIYDFLNPASVDTNDCEFLDGAHAGDVASARVLKAIGERNPAFAKYLNMKQIDWAIQNRSGHVYSGKDFGKYKEVDFLELGCKKH